MRLILGIGVIFFSIAISNASQLDEQILKNMGWIPQKQLVCGGYFSDPMESYLNAPLTPIKNSPTRIEASQSSFSLHSTSTLSGHVTVTQIGRQLKADQAYFYRDASGKINSMKLMGHLKLQEPGILLLGDRASMQFSEQSGYFENITYRVALAEFVTPEEKQHLNAWGQAHSAQQKNANFISLNQASYTTCSPTDPTWQLKADKIELDKIAGRGKAYQTWLYFRTAPVFYSPYLNFPIDNRRQSGFLFPTFKVSSQSGFVVSMPYYFNLAPNYDFTLTPVLYTKRTGQLKNNFRYLTPHGDGAIDLFYFPYDAQFREFVNSIPTLYPNSLVGPPDHYDRTYVGWQDDRKWSENLHSSVDFNWVSDDYYLTDFPEIPTVATNQLRQTAALDYTNDRWHWTAALNHYQTLHPVNQTFTTNPYNSLPEISLAQYTTYFYGLALSWQSQLNYFQRAANPGETEYIPHTLRFHLQPRLSTSWVKPEGYLIPTAELAMSYYRIGNPYDTFEREVQRVIPIISVDSGAYFDRDLSLFQHHYHQTLEPRIFYLFVPYRNQDDIPVFDTALIPFSYESLFNTNRFSHFDRIGDANQISVSLSTRILDALTNYEKVRISVGQIYYFRDRKIQLCSNPPNASTLCQDPETVVGATSSTSFYSPFVGQLSYQLQPHWNLIGGVSWDPDTRSLINGTLTLHYQNDLNRIFNINYNQVRFGDVLNVLPTVSSDSHKNDLNRAGFSFAWPLTQQWSHVGGLEYNFSHDYTQNVFYGVQYDACCWAVRILAGRLFYQLDQNNRPSFNNLVYVQLKLKGLSTLGFNDISSFLMDNIMGYRDNFQSMPRLANRL
jgi:LPS-assembly protein